MVFSQMSKTFHQTGTSARTIKSLASKHVETFLLNDMFQVAAFVYISQQESRDFDKVPLGTEKHPELKSLTCCQLSSDATNLNAKCTLLQQSRSLQASLFNKWLNLRA